MMMITPDLLLGMFQLPLRQNEESEALVRAGKFLDIRRADVTFEHALVVMEDYQEWVGGAPATKELIKFADLILSNSEIGQAGLTGAKYFDTHAKLMQGNSRDSRGLSQYAATRLLSRTLLIKDLLERESASTSHIAKLLGVMEDSFEGSYQSILTIAKLFDAEPRLGLAELENDIWPSDETRSRDLFTDASLQSSCQIAEEACRGWVPDIQLAHLLELLVSSLFSDNPKDHFWPYLQILHWCCLPTERYDHPVSYVYEFAPRGQTANSLFSKYSSVATGNPVLNNAKAVAQLDSHWARNRPGDDAYALTKVLQLLESLPFLSRREVARVIRAWLIRVIELMTGQHSPLEATMNQKLLLRLCNFVINEESNSRGVIEQRIVDALSVLLYPRDRWKEHGIGDSVNASNVSMKKLGDIEFVDVDSRKAVALEAHGGVVSSPYVHSHQRSLGRILEKRVLESWSLLDDPDQWSVTIIFIAHSFSGDLPLSETIFDVTVNYEYITYEHFVSACLSASTTEAAIQSFQTHFIGALNQNSVPQWIRNHADSILTQGNLT